MPPRRTALALFALFALAAPEGAVGETADGGAPHVEPPGRWLLDRVVAAVEGRPIVLSELDFEARVALIGRGGVEAASGPLPEEVLSSALDFAIGQRLAHAEAERLQVFAVEEEEVAAALAAFASRFANEKAYRDFLAAREASPDRVASLLRRDLRVARYLESKLKLLTRVSEDELRRFYATHSADFGGQAYPEVREAIRTHLTNERSRDLARRQIEELREKSDVRLVAPLGPGPAAQPDPAPR